ncbi:MAG: type II toxin-antitoxin system RelE/ParE family toxin [Coxiellaceae bacterium]|nr:type II toxin-antitoxin system RelE/ParE family toxin [Coxiellaceae bacterium]
MEIFKYKKFAKWARSERITDKTPTDVTAELIEGQYETNLGAGLYKKRIARSGKGKRGSFRSLVAFKNEHRTVFMIGLAKNDRGNFTISEKEFYKTLSKILLKATKENINKLVKKGDLIKIKQVIS